MTRGILIVGTDSSLLTAVAAEAGRRVEQFAAAFIPNRLSDLERIEMRGRAASRISLSWNPGSPISARTLVLAALNRLEHIDEAILICTPPLIRSQAEGLLPAQVEMVVNDHIKGWFFLVKELCQAFKTRGSGTLALVLSDINPEDNNPEDLMGPSVAASFRALAQGLINGSFKKPYQTLAFSSELREDAGFAAHIFKIMEEGGRRNSGKWHKYSKIGLFSR